MMADIWPEGWRVDVDALPRGTRGLTLYRERRSVIADGLHQWQHRATSLHEAIHAHSGPVPRWMTAREERRVDQEAARRLIGLDALIEALQVSPDARCAAALLEVPEYMVWARLQGLTGRERAQVVSALVELQ